MRFRIRRIFLILTTALILIMGCGTFASAADYNTTNYNVQINVKDNNSAYITEKISVDIYNQIHGIYRYIPLSQEITYNDSKGEEIKKVRNPLGIQDISVVNDKYEIENKSGNKVIKIGDSNKYIHGKKTYSLSYMAKMYDDGVKEYDSFYYNVLPTDWETPIEKSGITITMPKKFDKENVDVYAGSAGTRDAESKVKYSVKGNTITITAKEELAKGEGITIGIKLPEGYFSGEASTLWMKLLVCVIALLAALLMALLWFKFGRDPKTVKTIEFEPPEGISPAEVGYIIDGEVDKKDVVSLIFWFAQKGYLSIEENGKKDFILRKEADLPGSAKEYEKTFFNGLFAQGTRESVSMAGLGDDFYTVFQDTKKQVEESFEKNKKTKIFPDAASKSRVAAFGLLIIGFVVAMLVICKMFSEWTTCVPLGVLGLITFFSCKLGIAVTDKKYATGKTLGISKALLSLILLAISIVGTILYAQWAIGFLYAGVAMGIMVAVAYFTIRFMQSRTKYGAEMLGKILGFKEFIRAAEVEKLEAMVEDNPSYFFDVLPYAYVMGLSKKWSKKFENIPTEEPYWYRGYYGNDYMFNTWIFFSVFNSCTNFANDSIRVPGGEGVSGNFGGGFGGGGFSGGGFGGGGGGSW